ncbi:threonylcarbamoyl-AMP synthase [candidate division GN15 bacterium]|nr:threonylcarbamoyl-AMP synthase [candidate division GN15 bacterium]
MVLERISIDFDEPTASAVARAVAVLESGGLVVAPTETRYGLLARADRAEAVQRLVRAKGRDFNQPVAVFVQSTAALWEVGRITLVGEALARRFLPGPLTLVLEAQVAWPPPVVVGGKIGLRLSDAPIILKILSGIGVSLTATSANRSGSQELTRIDEIAAQLGADVDIYLDAGPLDRPVSTVVDGSGDRPVVLREGAIESEQIAQVLNGK